jgi:hypothetical protein
MILSKSNIIRSNSIALNTGAISSGALVNVQNPDFSKVVSSTSTTFKFTFASVGSSKYVSLHGISFPIGAVVTVTGTGFSETYTMVRDIKNLVFYVGTAVTLNSLAIQVAGAGAKTISYVSAGLTTEVTWGVTAGQTLRYLSHNKRSRVATNSRGMPTKAIQEETNNKLNVNYTNAPKTWARTDFLEVLAHYDTDSIVSMIDYEADDNPEESYCMFDLTGGEVKAHAEAPLLVNVTMSFRVIA